MENQIEENVEKENIYHTPGRHAKKISNLEQINENLKINLKEIISETRNVLEKLSLQPWAPKEIPK